MAEQNTDQNVFKKVVTITNSAGEMKTQVTIDLKRYDTSTMSGWVEGNPIYKGFTCRIATLKPAKSNPRKSIDIDPSDTNVRNAIMAMYEAYDKVAKTK